MREMQVGLVMVNEQRHPRTPVTSEDYGRKSLFYC